MIKRVGKRGDTLIEVMLAVGIFSMVAVAVVAVMSGGTSSAQTALETTLAREEIDAQAEALRFIQASYIADKNDGEESKYSKLWKAITGKAYNYDAEAGVWSDISAELSQYSPSSCSVLYEGNNDPEAKTHGFILNTRKLGTFEDPGDVISTGDYLDQASTYPHLIFGDNNGQLSNENFNSVLQKAEGIYIIAVKDPKSTTVAGSDSIDGRESAYYDFYIRTCWYGTGDQTPSTISTVMRLYDPDAIKEIRPESISQDDESDPSAAESSPGQQSGTSESEATQPTAADLRNSPYAVSKKGVFAIIPYRPLLETFTYTAAKNNDETALVGFLCYQSNSNYRIIPVLVSPSREATTYQPNSANSISDTIIYQNKTYYYFGGWTHSSYTKYSCTNNHNTLNKSVIKTNGRNYEIFLFNYVEGQSSGNSATRETAKALLKAAL